MSESATSSISPILPPSITTLADLKPGLIFYLRKPYLGQLNDKVFRCLRQNRITGSWSLYMREEDYSNWLFTRAEARNLVYEARTIKEGDPRRGARTIPSGCNT
ncbi:hypothetical protein Q9L58_009436 [Maublancomyces gigas]|uniref:Uncharacterized protein n=1 Tax=Discina gigas TaxID=1032678 RepID=A0ABR3G7M5_9PEZI